jgi:hypothetical protein
MTETPSIPDPWSNLSASPHDDETDTIDRLEGELGEISESARGVRHLITRFEACHFKCLRHLEQILHSIDALEAAAAPEQIGAAHPRHGPSASEGDPSGRSTVGRHYIDSMRHWLGEGGEGAEPPEPDAAGELDRETEGEERRTEGDLAGDLGGRVHGLLGESDPTKEKLVRRLIDRLLWRFEERVEGWEQECELDEQIDRTDICHSSFPRNLETVLSGIGKLKPDPDFSGCGSVDDETAAELRSRYEAMCAWIAGDSTLAAGLPVGPEPTKAWLVACLAKTIKEQCGLEGALDVAGLMAKPGVEPPPTPGDPAP